jgi:hypothetical protein
MSRARAALAALLMSGLLLTGCANGPQPASATKASALTAQLSRVDDALAAHRYAAARRALHDMIDKTRAAQAAGEVTAAEARPILASARRLLALLPTPSPTAQPETPAPSEPSPTHAPKPRRTPTPSAEPTPSASPSTPSTPSSPTSSPSATSSSSPTAAPSGQRSSAEPTPSPTGAAAP